MGPKNAASGKQTHAKKRKATVAPQGVTAADHFAAKKKKADEQETTESEKPRPKNEELTAEARARQIVVDNPNFIGS